MRAVLLLMCLLPALALAGPLERKLANDTYPYEALHKFSWAVSEEELGDLTGAIDSYKGSLSISPQAATYFNIGRLCILVDDVARAIESFAKYLELAPNAQDHKAITALLAELRARPPTVAIGSGTTASPDALVLMDGVIVGRSPAIAHPTPGRHFFERISMTSYAANQVTIEPHTSSYVEVHSSRRQRGNVVISVPSAGHGSYSFEEGARDMARHTLFPLPAGSYATSLGLHGDAQPCKPVPFTVKSVDVITYVHVTFAPPQPGATCSVAHVRTQQLTVGPP